MIYPFLEATGATFNNANKGVAAYLPKMGSMPRGAMTLQLRISDDEGAFDDCDINIISTSEGAAAHSGERPPSDETIRVQHDAGANSTGRLPLFDQAAANDTYKFYKAGAAVERYRHDWRHHPTPCSVHDLEHILAAD